MNFKKLAAFGATLIVIALGVLACTNYSNELDKSPVTSPLFNLSSTESFTVIPTSGWLTSGTSVDTQYVNVNHTLPNGFILTGILRVGFDNQNKPINMAANSSLASSFLQAFPNGGGIGNFPPRPPDAPMTCHGRINASLECCIRNCGICYKACGNVAAADAFLQMIYDIMGWGCVLPTIKEGCYDDTDGKLK